LSCLVLSGLVLPCLVFSCLVLSCLVLSCLVLSCLVSCLLSCLVLSCLVFCRVLSCLVLSCLVLPLSCLVRYCTCLHLATTNMLIFPLNDAFQYLAHIPLSSPQFSLKRDSSNTLLSLQYCRLPANSLTCDDAAHDHLLEQVHDLQNKLRDSGSNLKKAQERIEWLEGIPTFFF
jgi:hypothetical protein